MLLRFLHRGLRARLLDHRAEIAALVGAIRPGDVAVDVGANKGSFLPSLSHAVGPGMVVAFEPQLALADYLRRSCRAARLRNVVVEALGVSERGGSLTLHVPAGVGSAGASFEESILAISPCRDVVVPATSLDEYFRGGLARIAAIKVDVEGHELAVLLGAEDILQRHRPLLVVESEDRHAGPGGVVQMLRYLEERGYGGSFVYRSRLLPIRDFDPAVHQKQVGERFWDSRAYCNNFVMRRVGG
jgi:FkbM family methyltransferase